MTVLDNTPEYSVSELARALKRTVEESYSHVRVRGELGRVTIARSGHVYLDLKDADAVIDGVMWKGLAANLNFRPEEGLEVVAEGRLSTYPGRSKYQIIIERLAPAGAGALMALLEERKTKLAAEGLFAPEARKPIPYLPRVIGVVTSPTGAVIRDILHRLEDRFGVHVIVWPVVVQGDQAAGQVAAAIEGFNALPAGGAVPRPDVLIVARGGGSVEDLWAFNEEIVVRAAAASQIPLISAVGHETDTTLIDHAADRRAPTPTGAAEMAVPVRRELVERVQTCGGRLYGALQRSLERKAGELASAARALPRPEALIGDRAQRLDWAGRSLDAALKLGLERRRSRLEALAARARPQGLRRDIADKRRRLDDLANRLTECGRRALTPERRDLTALSARLEALSHKSVLARGYVLVKDETGGLVRTAASTRNGQAVTLGFSDGERGAVIGSEGAKSSATANRRSPARSKPPSPGQGSLF